MKKIILSVSLVLVFLVYIIFKKTSAFDILTSNNTGENPNNSETSVAQNSVAPAPSYQSPTPLAKVKNSTPLANNNQSSQLYKDGQFVGSVADAYYGNVQVKAIIQNGLITDVQFLQYPSDRRTSIQINSQATPYLISEAIQAQSAQVDIVSGATQTSLAFRESLASALAQAKN